MKEYVAIFEPGATNWSAYVPDLPGCVAAGPTLQETQDLIREAIEFHIEGLRLDNTPIPDGRPELGAGLGRTLAP